MVRSPYLDWAVASAPLEGEPESGDLHLVKGISTGLLLAVVDGLGHGVEAAAVARRAVETLAASTSESIIVLIRECHAALRGSRGAVMSLATLNVMEGTMTWIAVGNVEGVLARADMRSSHPMESVVMRNGVVGLRLPTLNAAVLSVAPGDLVVFATDGIKRDFKRGLRAGPRPADLAARILEDHRLGHDDALVLVGEYLGSGGKGGEP